MDVKSLDLIFPFLVLAYGFLVTVALSVPTLARLAEERLAPPLLAQLNAHRWLAAICLVVGGLWSLQNLWFREALF